MEKLYIYPKIPYLKIFFFFPAIQCWKDRKIIITYLFKVFLEARQHAGHFRSSSHLILLILHHKVRNQYPPFTDETLTEAQWD